METHFEPRIGDYKIIQGSKLEAPLLFDLSHDPTESRDLWASQPELAQGLIKKMNTWSQSQAEPMWPIYNWKTGKKFPDVDAKIGNKSECDERYHEKT